MSKTYSQSKEDAKANQKWYLVDATGVPVGRVASEVAGLLRGKHKTTFTPHVDGGDFVVVVNADKVKFTGNKLDQKTYYKHSGYVGGLKSVTAGRLMETFPERVLENAIKGMLPKGKLGRAVYKKLNVYAGGDHPHVAQKPEAYELKYAQAS